MATRGTIAVEHENGKVSQVYSHWDNYLSHNGRLLAKHYNSRSLAEMLVALGSISSLGERVIPNGEHSFANPEKGCTVFYGRDRGEDDTSPSHYRDYDDYRKNAEQEEYDYIFRNGKWWVKFYDTDQTWIELDEALAREEAAQAE